MNNKHFIRPPRSDSEDNDVPDVRKYDDDIRQIMLEVNSYQNDRIDDLADIISTNEVLTLQLARKGVELRIDQLSANE